MLKDNIKAMGTLELVLTDANGNVKQQSEKNLVVFTGLAYIADRVINADTPVMSHMAIGANAVAAAGADVALGSELGRVGLVSTTQVTTNSTDDAVQYVATFSAGVGTGAVTEAGIFNNDTAGIMLSRTVFPVINKGEDDTLTITWKITVA